MGLETAALVALAAGSVAGGTAAIISANQNKPNIPKSPNDAGLEKQDDIATSAQSRQDRARKQALAASGRSDTILTSSQGLGGNGQQQQNFQNMGKTLLGQ